MSLLHVFLLFAISGFKFFSLRSPFMLSIHLLLGLLLLLFPCTSISVTSLLTWSSATLLLKYPYHLNLDFRIFLEISVTFTVPLIYSFLIQSLLVTPTIHLSIFISATSIFFSSLLFRDAASSPYVIAGLAIAL